MKQTQPEDPAIRRVRAIGDTVVQVIVTVTAALVILMIVGAVAHKMWTS